MPQSPIVQLRRLHHRASRHTYQERRAIEHGEHVAGVIDWAEHQHQHRQDNREKPECALPIEDKRDEDAEDGKPSSPEALGEEERSDRVACGNRCEP